MEDKRSERERATDEVRRKMALLDKHKGYLQMSTEQNQRELYLGTNNRRPGPSLEESKAERDVLLARKQRDQAKKEPGAMFNPLSAHVELAQVDWRGMKSMENIKGGVFAIGMKFGGFVLKGAADIVAAYFCNRLY